MSTLSGPSKIFNSMTGGGSTGRRSADAGEVSAARLLLHFTEMSTYTSHPIRRLWPSLVAG